MVVLSTADVDFSKLTIKPRIFTSVYMQIIYLYFPPDTSHCGHFQQFHSGRHDAYLELPSHSFSLEISIITKPPTVKRLSKNARHLATLKSCGLTRGGGGGEKNTHTSSKTSLDVISCFIPVVIGSLNQ